MGRKKLELHLIEDMGQRKRTYHNRIKGLKKKSFELATLCAVPSMIISFGPQQRVDTWPESIDELQHIIRRYNSSSSRVRDSNKVVPEVWDPRLNGMSEGGLREIIASLDSKLAEARERMQLLNKQKETSEEGKRTSYGYGNGDVLQFIVPFTGYEPMDRDQDCELMDFNSFALGDTLETKGKVFEEVNAAGFDSLKDCLVSAGTVVAETQPDWFESYCESACSVSPVFPLTKQMIEYKNVAVDHLVVMDQIEAVDSDHHNVALVAPASEETYTSFLLDGSSFGELMDVSKDDYFQYPCELPGSISVEDYGIFDDCNWMGGNGMLPDGSSSLGCQALDICDFEYDGFLRSLVQ